MNKVLITGISGQDGIYLSSKLFAKNSNIRIYGITRSNNSNILINKYKKINSEKATGNIKFLNVDFNDYETVNELLLDFKPDILYNLSGPSSVNNSFGKEKYYFDNLIGNFDNILKSVNTNRLNTKIFQASSSEMFDISNRPLHETSIFKPRNPYSHAKYIIHNKIANHRKENGTNISSGIMFNHESELREKNFLIMKIINAAIEISKDKSKTLKVGSLDYCRDWSFAGDIMDAAILITQKDMLQDYVLGSGKGTKVKAIVEYIFNYFNLNWEDHVYIDNSILRPNDPESIISNPTKIYHDLGWKTVLDIEVILSRMIKARLDIK